MISNGRRAVRLVLSVLIVGSHTVNWMWAIWPVTLAQR